LKDRLAGAPRDPYRILDGAVGRERADPQLGRVPRHVGVVPGEPTERRAVGADARRGVELVSLDEHAARRGIAVDVERDDGVDVLRALDEALVFPHAQDAAARPVELVVGEAQILWCGERVRRAAPHLPVDPLVGEVRKIDDASARQVVAAAVLVHARTDVELRGGHVGVLPVVRSANEDVASVVRGAHLGPEHVVAVEGELPEADRARDDHVGRDGRLPGAARSAALRTVAHGSSYHRRVFGGIDGREAQR
jgi:hypothetical protein